MKATSVMALISLSSDHEHDQRHDGDEHERHHQSGPYVPVDDPTHCPRTLHAACIGRRARRLERETTASG